MLTERDYELLSAYLDGALNDLERTALESRLQESEELRRKLDELRETVALIKALPVLKAPRNFTLNTQRSSNRWLVFPTTAAFSAISAAAATILITISALLISQSARLIPTAGFGADSNAQPQAAQQEIALNPTGTAIPSDIAQTVTVLSINDGLTVTAQIEEAQKQFRAEMTATALSLVIGQANSASGGETDVNADQAAGAAMPAQAPTVESETNDAILPTNASMQFAPSEASMPATAITDGFMIQATALPDTASDLAQFSATALPPAASVMLESAGTATPALELSRERQGTPTPLPTSIPPATTTLNSTAIMMATATLSLPPPTPTVSPATQVAIAATTSPRSDEQITVSTLPVFSLALLVIGVALLIVAIGTTLARRRR